MRDDGLVAVVKRDCPTCVLVAPVVAQLAAEQGLTVYSQDDPGFPDDLDLTGKIALILRFEPMNESGRSRWAERGSWSSRCGNRTATTAAPVRPTSALASTIA